MREIVREENDKVKAAMGEEAYANGRYEDAAQLMIDLVEQPAFEEFLTLPAYERILADEKASCHPERSEGSHAGCKRHEVLRLRSGRQDQCRLSSARPTTM